MITLPHGYIIDADSTCYTLARLTKVKKTDKKTGEVRYEDGRKNIGYYSRLNQAFVAYSDELDRELVGSREMSLKTAMEAIIESRESVKEAIREALPEIKENG